MMADRYTRKDAEKCLERFAKIMGKNIGFWKKEGDKVKPQIGNWDLDYNPIYGGAVIVELHNEQGGEDTPFGMQRRNPREFCDAISFAENAIRIKLKKVI